MPREIAHWWILRRAVERSDDAVRSLWRSSQPYFELGAVLHDAPYYLRRGNDPTGRQLAEYLHGTGGEDTLAPWRAVLEIAHSEKDPVLKTNLLALTFGAYSHYIADIAYHPAIFYFTGNYYDVSPALRSEARGKHRLLEVYLDSWFRALARNEPFYSIRQLMNAAESASLQNVFRRIAPALVAADSETGARILSQSMLDLATIQRHMLSSATGALFRIASLTKYPSITELDALSSFGRRSPLTALGEQYRYQHPITGTEYSFNVQQLADNCADSLGHAFSQMLVHGLSEERGLSLSFAMENVRPIDAQYFSTEGLPLPGLRSSN